MGKDSRMVSFVKDLEKDGTISEIVNFVKNSKRGELELCFRGNSQPEAITIYRNNHMVWNVKKIKNNYEIDISLNHARYTQNWKKKINEIN